MWDRMAKVDHVQQWGFQYPSYRWIWLPEQVPWAQKYLCLRRKSLQYHKMEQLRQVSKSALSMESFQIFFDFTFFKWWHQILGLQNLNELWVSSHCTSSVDWIDSLCLTSKLEWMLNLVNIQVVHKKVLRQQSFHRGTEYFYRPNLISFQKLRKSTTLDFFRNHSWISSGVVFAARWILHP